MQSAPADPVAANSSILLTVTWRAWRLFGREFGPERSAVLRIALIVGGPPIIERVDRRPLGVIAERCREPIEQALRELRERAGQRRTTNRIVRERAQADTAGSASTGTASAASPAQPTPEQPGSGLFRYDRQGVTDRIERMKRDGRAAEPPPAASDAKTGALARLAELRAQQAARKPDGAAVTPFDEVPDVTTVSPDKRTSSVFRYDREVITDRITRLKHKAEEPPPQQRHPTTDTWGKG